MPARPAPCPIEAIASLNGGDGSALTDPASSETGALAVLLGGTVCVGPEGDWPVHL